MPTTACVLIRSTSCRLCAGRSSRSFPLASCYARGMWPLRFLLFSAMLCLSGCAGQQSPSYIQNATSTPVRSRAKVQLTSDSSFDFFLLNLSWSPEYCHSHPSAQECAQHKAFVLHGLWPERKDGSYPENCSDAPGPSDPGKYADVYGDAGLLAHEWLTHGTCSGLTPDAYFADARTAYNSVKLPGKLVQLSSQVSLAPDEISSLFMQSNPDLPASSIVITCGNNYLTAVEVCLDKNLNATSCGAVRSCRANSVRIPKP